MSEQATTVDLRYPVGRFSTPTAPLGSEERARFIEAIAVTPARLTAAVAGLDESQLDTPYRPDGWTVRQVVHHLADSHINAFTRFKLALTESAPTIKPYDEAAWARLPDADGPPHTLSLALLEGLHARWVTLLRSMDDSDFRRTLVHPERGSLDLDFMLALYAWHGEHHVAHVTGLRERSGW